MNKKLPSLQKTWIAICFFNFFIAAFMGVILRYGFVTSISFNFKYLIHAHSHIAMLGWVYLMLYSFIVDWFIPIKNKRFTYLFWLTQLAVIGMMLSFPLQGYAIVSISFSTLHILCSYYFIQLVWKNQQNNSLPEKWLLKAALLFMFLSTIGIWCLGPAVAIAGKESVFYHLAIQFFLHFQFNGWFLLAVLALLFKYLSTLSVAINEKHFSYFFNLLILSTFLTFALPISWYVNHFLFFWINALGILMQLMALVILVKIIRPYFYLLWKTSTRTIKKIIFFTSSCVVLKILLQTTSLFPEIAANSFHIKQLVIGFIHLTMLGVISGFLLWFFLQRNEFSKKNNLVTWGINFFLLGFLGTEFLLFVQGGMYYFQMNEISNYNLLLLSFSVFLLVGISLLFMRILDLAFKINTNQQKR